MSKEIVPFGKYKGQPLEAIVHDKQYVDWLCSQDWFREKFGGLHSIIINNFSEPTETPEHNSLQVMFLDDDFCLKFLKLLCNHWIQALKTSELAIIKIEIQKRIDLLTRDTPTIDKETIEKYHNILQKLPDVLTFCVNFDREFETRQGVDVHLTCTASSIESIPGQWDNFREPCPVRDSQRFNIELKPSVGDDYPTILRQMKSSRSDHLVTRQYTGRGATQEQFVATFAASGIKVIFLDQIV